MGGQIHQVPALTAQLFQRTGLGGLLAQQQAGLRDLFFYLHCLTLRTWQVGQQPFWVVVTRVTHDQGYPSGEPILKAA